MEKFHKETLTKLEMAINELEIEADYSIQRIEAAINLILDSLSEIKEYVAKTGFKDNDEEIRFFKFLKPTIVAKLIYCNAIYKIETKKPYGANHIKKYLNTSIVLKIQTFQKLQSKISLKKTDTNLNVRLT